jgi:hypothetical protein
MQARKERSDQIRASSEVQPDAITCSQARLAQLQDNGRNPRLQLDIAEADAEASKRWPLGVADKDVREMRVQ